MDSLSALLMGTGAANVNLSNGYSGGGQGGRGGAMPMFIDDVPGEGGSGSRKGSLTFGRPGGKAEAETTYPDWKMELTMERLKQKVAQIRSFAEMAKNVRTAIMERRTILDHNDKQHLQKSLDVLQQNIKVNSLQSMVERLEMVSRQQGLRFHPGGTGNEWFISSDMFFLELLIGSDGVVQEVKIQHDGKTGQQNCPEIITALQKHDFSDFSAHLAGLVSIYALNADKNIKSKVFIALQALEADLATIASSYASDATEGDLVVMKSLLGVVKSRTGGHPLRITFYISPYEFLDPSIRSTFPNDVPSILKNGLGTVATVAVQASQSHKLQMSGVVSLVKNEGKSVPRYGALNATNSTALPACFTFNLQKPVAVCTQILEKINAITGIPSVDPSVVTMTAKPILRLLTEHLLENGYNYKNGHTRRRERGLFIELPDQLHCYYMTEMLSLDAVLVSSVPFTLASQLPPIIALLRQQFAFNTLVGSCIRSGAPPPPASPTEKSHMVFEISPLSFQNITVTFQHPLEESLVTLEVDLREVSHPLCKLHAMHPNAGVGRGVGMEIIPTLEEHACRVATRTMSIPVTLRAVIRRWKAIRAAYEPPPPVHEIQTGGGQRPSSTGSFDAHQQPTSCRTESAADATGSHRGSVPTMVTANAKQQQQQPPRVSSAPAAPLSTSTLTISPVVTIPASAASASTSPNTAGVDLLSYMNMANMGMGNPLLKGLGQFPNLPGLHSLASSPAYQMLATQLAASAGIGVGSGSPTKSSQAALMELLEQVRNSTGVGGAAAGKKRKRKSSSTSGGDSPAPAPVPILPAPTPAQRGHGAGLGVGGPKRRMSESNDPGADRVPTPNTIAREIMMSEYGLDSPRHAQAGHGRGGWPSAHAHGIDITPVGMDSFMAASKLLSAFGAAAAANIKQEPMDPAEFMQPKKGAGGKRPRDNAPKRSMSLDSAHLQTLGVLQDAAGRMVPPSLSITPVPAGAGGGAGTGASGAGGAGSAASAAAQAILAGMKPGIEIIPLHGHGAMPINIPNSITVTPIVSKSSSTSAGSSGGGSEKKPTFTKKMSADEFEAMLGKKKRVVEKQRKGSLSDDMFGKKGGGAAVSAAFGLDKKSLASLGMGLSQKTGTPGLLPGLKKAAAAAAGSPLGKAASASPMKPGPKASSVSGKPGLGVATLKSATGSSTTTITTATSTSTSKPKPKDKKPGFTLTPSTGSPKPLSKSSSFPAPPTLRPIYDTAGGGVGAMSGGARSEPSTPTTPTTPGGGGGLLGSAKKGSGFVQTGTVTKKLGLAGIVDKLKSQASVESASGTGAGPGDGGAASGKKELSRLDYLKASSTITTEMQNLQKGKGNASSSGNGNGNGGQKSPSPVPGGNANPEYTVRQGGGGPGLKLTIKTPLPGSAKGEKSSAAKGSPGIGGVKRPFSPNAGGSAAGGASKGSGSMAGLKGAGAVPPKKAKLDSGSGRASPSPKEQQLDLTKKLFQPGAVRSLEPGGAEAPKFNTSFQIPKKKPATPPITGITAAVATSTTAEATPTTTTPTKEVKTPSPPSATAAKVSPQAATAAGSVAEEAKMAVDDNSAEKNASSAPASPDASSPAPMQEDHVTTPTIPTTPTAAAAPLEPELPVLEHSNNTPSAAELGDTPASPHESTPPVLELQQQFTMAGSDGGPPEIPMEPVQAEEGPGDSGSSGSAASASSSAEMPPPPLPLAPSTPNPNAPSPSAGTPSSPAPVIAAVPSPLMSVTSPSPASAGVGTTVTSIVHIVHSPQPNSPIPANVMLRSPLVVVQSPHSAGGGGGGGGGGPAASPFQIDDDLMDEALTGGANLDDGAVDSGN